MGIPFENSGSSFTCYGCDGITIMASDDVAPEPPDGTIEIGLKKYLFSREITVRGVRIEIISN